MSFKVRLLLGAAAPFVFALPAMAQVKIETATTAPINTATAGTGNTPANVEITSAGSITPATADNLTILTIGSANSVINAGTLSVTNSNGTTAVRIAPNLANSYTQSGNISVIEDYTRPDTDNDKDLDGPFAQGTGRTGLLLSPGGTMNGSINLAGGSISVEGNNSAGVSLQSAINGNYRQKASIGITGDNSIAVDIQQNVSGNVQIGGTTNAQGQNSQGVRVLGNVGGEFLIDGSIIATGFTSTTFSNYVDPDLLQPGDPTSAELLDPEDLLVGGSALTVRGNLARGVLVNGAATGGTDPTPDVKDVVQNFNENRSTGAVTSFGSAPAFLLQPLDGSSGQNISLGLVRETVLDTLDDDDDDNVDEVIGTFDYTFGFMNRGTIGGNGLNTGFTGTGLKIAGSADGTHTTTIAGGVFNSGTIFSSAFEADSVAIDFGAGASTPQLLNQGTISATVNTETTHDAVAVLVRQGATLPSLTNTGLI